MKVAVAKTQKKARNAGRADKKKPPPRPPPPLLKRKLRQPQIHDADPDDRAAERDAIVKQEVNDLALIHRAQLLRRHSQILNIVREKLSGGGLHQREAAAEDQAQAGE